MATVVNNPSSDNSGNNQMGFFMGMIVLLVVVVVLVYVGLPALRSMVNTSTQQAPSVEVPDQVDVNVDTPQQ